MSEERYDVVFCGNMVEGFDFEGVKAGVIKFFSVTEQVAERVLKSRAVVLRKALSQQAAERYRTALQRIGMLVSLRPSRFESAAGTAALSPGRRASEPVPVNVPQVPGQAVALEHAQTAEVVQAAAPEKATVGHCFHFNGKGAEYFRIWLVNIVLSILTFGIYSAWAKVRTKRYFYGNTRVAGGAFEYLAEPKQILKGRLLVAGFFAVSSVLAQFMPPIAGLLNLAFVFALPWLVVRSLAFNAHNSAMRNIRFGFDGMYGQAAKVFLMWPTLAMFTLGFLWPYAYFRQKKFIVENSRYGTTRLTFSAKSGDYYKIFCGSALVIVGGAVIAVLCSFLFPPLAILAGVIAYLYLFAFLSVKTTNVLFNAAALGEHRFQATMKVKDWAVLVLTNTLATALTLGLFHPWARIRALRYKTEHLTLIPGGNLEGFVAAEQQHVSALGEEVSDFMDFDFGL